MKKFLYLVVLLLIISSVMMYHRRKNRNYNYVQPEENLLITSQAFNNEQMIPIKYTGYGEDISPPITIQGIDSKGKSIAIVMDDIDTPMGTLNHWVIWNIPVHFIEIPAGIEKDTIVESLEGAIQGKSGYGGKHYYRGPKPPSGTHRYIFRVYILDQMLSIDEDSDKVSLQKAMEDHILQYGTIEGRYSH